MLAEYAGYREVKDALKSIDIGMNTSSRVFPFSIDYNNGVTLNVVVKELTRNIMLAMACVFLCTFFLIGNIITTIIVCLTVSITITNVAGRSIGNNKESDTFVRNLEGHNIKVSIIFPYRIHAVLGTGD